MEIPELEKWIEECPPTGFCTTFYFSIDSSWWESEKEKLTSLFYDSHLQNCQLDFIDCEIDPSLSFYDKDKSIQGFDVEKYKYGKKSGPNIQFFESLKKLSKKNADASAAILLETDAHPIKCNWLLELNQRLQWMGKDVYVAGSKAVLAEIQSIIKQHINGNAIYHVGKEDFFDFLMFWERLLLESTKVNPDLAYDVVIEWSYHMSKLSSAHTNLCQVWNEANALKYKQGIVNISKYLANISGAVESGEFEITLRRFLDKNPQLLIIHGRYFNQSGNDIVVNEKQRLLQSQITR